VVAAVSPWSLMRAPAVVLAALSNPKQYRSKTCTLLICHIQGRDHQVLPGIDKNASLTILHA
jgi:hypothetical protein